MSLKETLRPHIPFLRRYARALTGDQTSGDTYIRASLEALAASPDGFDASLDPRIAIYRFFHGIWGSTGEALESPTSAQTGDTKLQALAPIQRQAFLLTSMEGFSKPEAAIILRKDEAEITSLVDAALKEIDEALATEVLIIEDEPVIAADLEHLIQELGHACVGIATTRDEAVTLAKEKKPGLVLCDIQLADNSSGIDAAHDILEDLDVPIIFITAFPERLLTGERPEPTFLIPKPFQDIAVKAAIGQALFFR